MLILARRPGERVVIGDEILVTVMEVSASTVRLGIEAPRGVSIFREEIWLAVKEENRAAAEATADAFPSQLVSDAPLQRASETASQTADNAPQQPEGETSSEATSNASAQPHDDTPPTPAGEA
jgi:carbon storage regulator